MFERKIVSEILARLRESRKRIQIVVGPRQVGKTFAMEQTLRRFKGSFDYRLAEGLGINPSVWLESEWNAARIKATGHRVHILVIDEIQKIAGWPDVVKRLWDEDSFSGVPLKVVLLGSSRLLLEKGLHESLAGRFEIIEAAHWSFAEMNKAFDFSLEDYILFGAYPGAQDLRSDESRWRSYLKDSIIEPSISKDILQLETITKPALLRQLFTLGCTYSGRILSYQKMLGQLQDAGNATTLAHYLHLLDEAGLLCGLEKFYEEGVRMKASSPKLVVRNIGLMTALLPYSHEELRRRGDLWGHVVESAVGAHLLATARADDVDVLYWNVGAKEVDYVLRKGDALAALEVKTTDADSISGMKEFKAKYPRVRTCLVGGQGLPLEEFFRHSAADFL